jgi:hypothetical protein
MLQFWHCAFTLNGEHLIAMKSSAGFQCQACMKYALGLPLKCVARRLTLFPYVKQVQLSRWRVIKLNAAQRFWWAMVDFEISCGAGVRRTAVGIRGAALVVGCRRIASRDFPVPLSPHQTCLRKLAPF